MSVCIIYFLKYPDIFLSVRILMTHLEGVKFFLTLHDRRKMACIEFSLWFLVKWVKIAFKMVES